MYPAFSALMGAPFIVHVAPKTLGTLHKTDVAVDKPRETTRAEIIILLGDMSAANSTNSKGDLVSVDTT